MEGDLKSKLRVLREYMFAGFHSFHGPETGGRIDAVYRRSDAGMYIWPDMKKRLDRRKVRRTNRGKGGPDAGS